MPEVSVIIDLAVVALLIATIAYAVVLNRKLARLRNAKEEMEALAGRFADSLARAESGIETLKDRAQSSGEVLQQRLDKARGLADDLAFLVEKGTSVANHLDSKIGATRAVRPDEGARAPREGAAETRAKPAPARPSAAASPQSQAVLKALQGLR